MTHPPMQLGRRAPKNAPALRLATVLTGTVPEHPVTVDHLGQVSDWGLYANDRYGDCGPVSVANQRKQITRYLLGRETCPGQGDVFDLYARSGNPTFDPADPGGPGDQGVDMQTMLEAVHHGGIAGVQALAFARVDPHDLDEVRAAIAIFGSVLVGVTLDTVQQDQTATGVWDYAPGSDVWGGHAVLAGSYTSHKTGADIDVVTWGRTIGATDGFWAHQAEEAWVVIWPEHLGTAEFEQGVDLGALARDYEALTGRPFPRPEPAPAPVPPVPDPSPVDMADRALAAVLRPWAAQAHRGVNHQAAVAARRWLTAKNLTTGGAGPRYATETELVQILAEVDLATETVTEIVTRLADLGVPVDRLVTVTQEYP